MIPFVDLNEEYQHISAEITKALDTVFKSCFFILGEQLENFEHEFADYLSAGFACGVNSGSDALYLALKAVGVGKNDEVITVSHTFISTADAIVRSGAKPVFVDIETDTYTIDVNKIEEKITGKTKVIVPVHLYGHPADMDAIMDIAKRHDLFVIEDACQAHGALYKNKMVGNIGHIGCFSFYPTKNLGAYGDGGIAVTNDETTANELYKLRNYGQSKKYYYDYVSINSRLDEIQAAILRVKLKYLDEFNEKRRKIAEIYNERLKGLGVTTPVEKDWAKHVYHLYVIRHKQRDKLQKYLANNDIQTQIHYPVPVHKQKSYLDKYGDFGLEFTEKFSKETLSLPIYPFLNEPQVRKVTEYITNFL